MASTSEFTSCRCVSKKSFGYTQPIMKNSGAWQSMIAGKHTQDMENPTIWKTTEAEKIVPSERSLWEKNTINTLPKADSKFAPEHRPNFTINQNHQSRPSIFRGEPAVRFREGKPTPPPPPEKKKTAQSTPSLSLVNSWSLGRSRFCYQHQNMELCNLIDRVLVMSCSWLYKHYTHININIYIYMY